MSIDHAIAGLVAALNANTAALQAHAGAPQAAPAPQQPPMGFPQAPQQPPVGMPPQPFPGATQPPPQPAQTPPVQLPFADAQGLMQWAYAKYQANNALMPAMEGIIKAHGLADLTQAQPAQFQSLYTAIAAL